MANLDDVRRFLKGRLDVVRNAERDLDALLQKYESFFGEVNAAREHELDQLTTATLEQRESLPDWFVQELEASRPEVEAEFSTRRKNLLAEAKKLRQRAEALRQRSIDAERLLAGQSTSYDRNESELEQQLEANRQALETVEAKITSLSHGLGFITRLPALMPLGRERRRLVRERAELAPKLEKLRSNWQERLAAARDEEAEWRQKWVQAETDAAAFEARVEALDLERPRILARSTVEHVLARREPETTEPSESDPACPRCAMPNVPGAAFCHICALRLVEDRPDFEGSLIELAELNRHHLRFSQGMQTCQETLGLVRGIRSGLEALLKSVDSMIETRRKHSLARLSLAIPESSERFGAVFDEIAAAASTEARLHPLVFAEQMRKLIDGRIGEAALEGFFNNIGDELTRAAEAKWD